jgi:hypothetical protein
VPVVCSVLFGGKTHFFSYSNTKAVSLLLKHVNKCGVTVSKTKGRLRMYFKRPSISIMRKLASTPYLTISCM